MKALFLIACIVVTAWYGGQLLYDLTGMSWYEALKPLKHLD